MIKTIIIDDEKGNVGSLKELLNAYCRQVAVVATAENVADAIRLIDAHKPELIFLDVELKKELGFDIFRHYPDPFFQVIFTTAHEKYALRAIKSSALEYLLKPVDYRELVRAVEKFEKQQHVTMSQKKISVLLENLGNDSQSFSKIAIPSSDGYSFVNTGEIIYCEADMNYTNVVTNKGEKILSTRNLKEFEEMLNPQVFFRCHKSWLINLNFIKKYSRTDGTRVLMANDAWIDISVRKREEFLKLFGKF
ncbi:MAG TPA: LytTR family DNA-binding domain-containing protein [Bacteroidia bacterium]|nr:LytTR family DNA-binding domain-containing protein [Bacteroidia bacterium]